MTHSFRMTDTLGLPTAKEVERVRKEYKEGDRVELVHMDDVQAPPVGTKGTVLFVDSIANIHVAWDNGSSLAVAYKEDKCKKI